MKRMLVISAVAALSVVGFTGTANAAPSNGANCFGQVHKSVNAGTAVDGITTVGQAVKALGGGQAKNDFAKAACA